MSVARLDTDQGIAEVEPSSLRPASKRPRWLKPVLLGALFVGTVLFMRRPTADSIFNTLPANTGDPALVAWIMSWDIHALLTHPRQLFHAPMFWPRSYTLAHSDLMLTAAPLFGLLHAVTGNFVAALNLTVLLLMVITQVATYLLAKRLTGRDDAAILAALAFTFSGYALSHWGHPQLQLLGLLPLGFLVLFQLLERPSTRNGLIFGVVTAAIALGALYYGAIFATCALAVVLGHLWSQRYRVKAGTYRALAIAVLVAGVLAAPFAYGFQQLHAQGGYERPSVPEWGLKAADVVTPAPRSYFYDWMARIGPERDGEHMHFPGFVVLAFGGVGLVGVLRRRPGHSWRDDVETDTEAPEARRHRELRLLTLAGAVSLILAIGPEVYGVTMPFGLLHEHVPGFGGIRVAARFAVIAWLALAMLAATGYVMVTRNLRLRVRTGLGVLVSAVILLELSAPAPTADISTSDETLAVYHALDDRGREPVVELPMVQPLDPGAGFPWATIESPRMLFSTIDWHPRVNGYSGYVPPGYAEDIDVLNTFPSPIAVERMRQLGVRYAVLHMDDQGYTPQQVADIVAALPAGSTARPYGNAWLVDIDAPPEAPSP